MTSMVNVPDSMGSKLPVASLAAHVALGDVRIISDEQASTRVAALRSPDSTEALEKLEVVTPMPQPSDKAPEFDTSPIQIWEGEVLYVHPQTGDVESRLRSKLSSLPDHDATISGEWVHEQDRDLVKVGAVFYMTLYKRKRRGSLENSQGIRFRRTVAWSAPQIANLKKTAVTLHKKLRTRSLLDEG